MTISLCSASVCTPRPNLPITPGIASQSPVMKRREVKEKGEKERYTHLNTEFQRIARRDKKAFLSDQ